MATIPGTDSSETLLGTIEDDVITALGGDDLIISSIGLDQIDGGDGSDTVDYAQFDTSLTVTLLGATTSQVAFDGTLRDSLVNIENVIGGSGNDAFFGDDLDNTFTGNAGHDYFAVSLGSDTFSGGEGYDTADYGQAVGAIRVKLAMDRESTVRFTAGVNDTLSSMENVFGSAFADKIVADGASNTLRGNGGDDRLDGRASGDELTGGTGNDRLAGGGDADIFVFATGDDRDVITDFDAVTTDTDRLDLTNVTAVEDFADLIANHAIRQGEHVKLVFGDGDSILLKHVDLADLDITDFIL